jgi:hypothetical protein
MRTPKKGRTPIQYERERERERNAQDLGGGVEKLEN